jgi:RNA polymerase sigma-70 factor, ECF subfamily
MDSELVIRARAGDRAAFTEIADGVLDRFLAVAGRILRDRALAEDAAQQALLATWRELPSLRDPARFDAWSYRLLVHACYSEARRGRHWLPSLGLDAIAEPACRDETSMVDDRDQLERAFRGLPADQRAVVVLHHYVGLPLDEVATVLGVPDGTVRSRLYRAMTALRAALGADAPSAAVASAMGVTR